MSTWGQLRLLVQTSFPEVTLDLIDGYLNAAYRSSLQMIEWTGLKAHSMIQTVAAYQSTTDTVTVTVGSAAVTGSGTTWTAAMMQQNFYIPGDTCIYTPTYVSPTALTLDRPYEGNGSSPGGTVAAGSSYVFMTNIYVLPNDCRSIESILDPITQLPMTPFTKDDLDHSTGNRALVGYPKSWAQYDNTPEGTPPVLQRVELYPPPLQARGYNLEYIRDANYFNGQNTSTSPLPFISDLTILSGARASCALHLEKYPKAQGYLLTFQGELDRIILLEHAQRRVITKMQMADRFTRHRIARVLRGYGRHGGMPNPPITQP